MLPIIDHPTYEVFLKSLNKTIKYRPFLVKEEKLLFLAKEADDINEVVKCIKQIISNCCLDEIDVDSLPTFDIEMFFLHLRINSVGENVQMIYTCDSVIDDNICAHKTEFELELKNVQYIVEPDHSNVIKLNDSVGLKFNYPTLNIPDAILNDKFEENAYEIIGEYLDCVFDESQVYKTKDLSKEELNNFFDNLSLEHVQKIKNFFIKNPKVALKQNVICSKCSKEKQIELEGILNFFE